MKDRRSVKVHRYARFDNKLGIWNGGAARYRRRLAELCLAIFVLIASGQPIRGQIRLSTDFASASLDLAGSTVNGLSVNLRGLPTWTEFPDFFRWVYFRADGVDQIRPTFRIGDNLTPFLGDLNGHRFVYSYDRQNWLPFQQTSISGTRYQFRNVEPFTQDHVYIAYSEPYEYERTVAKLQEWRQTPYVRPTFSGNVRSRKNTTETPRTRRLNGSFRWGTPSYCYTAPGCECSERCGSR